MRKRKSIFSFPMLLLIGITFAAMLIVIAIALAAPGDNDNGILNEEWRYDFFTYYWGYFGASPAIADLGPDVNTQGGEPDANLEIVSGSDDCYEYYPELGADAPGIWRCFDSLGNIEWATDTQSDEARGDPVIVDLDGDCNLEIAAGTTSGETIEILDRFGIFVWTFPDPPHAGNFMWDGGPAVADVDSTVDGLEVIASNRETHEIYALDGDNSDGVDDGYTWTGGWPWTGTEGVDWDILWIFAVPESCEIYATVALGDVDNDGTLEVAFGATNGVFYVLDAQTGAMETSYSLGGSIYASAALCNLDDDPYLEMVIGSTNNSIYALEWDGTTASQEWTYTTGGAVYSSAASGDIDGDGSPEVVVGSNDGNIYALDASGAFEWSYPTGGAVYSSPSLAKRGCGAGLGVYVGSEDTYLYLLDGIDGSKIDRFETHSGSCGPGPGIHTSPSIADVDGDGKLEIFFYDWGCGSANNGNTFWAVEDSGSNVPCYTIEWSNFRRDAARTGCYSPSFMCVDIDIKPGSCPNPLNPKSKGVMTVAVLGTEDFDVTTIDPANILLTRCGDYEGVEPLRWAYEDTAAPFEGEPCECHNLNGDGYIDLTLKFDTQELAGKLGLESEAGNTIPLTITVNLEEGACGTAIKAMKGSDCVRIK